MLEFCHELKRFEPFMVLDKTLALMTEILLRNYIENIN